MEVKTKMKNIGAVIGNLEAPHAYELMKGMSQAAEDYNVNLLVFPGMHSKSFYDKRLLEHREEFDYQFNTVYDYVLKEKIDMLLVSLGTVIDFLGTDNYQDFLLKYKNTPMIVLEDVVENETCITLDNRSGLYECIKHLIVNHGYKKIAFVSGRKNNFDAKERLAVYQTIMQEYNLPIEKGMIGYGDFTEYTDEVVGKILDEHPDVEAICFSNDMMALGGYRECKKRGLEVGKDIAITGFDDSQQAMSYDPPLTTVRVRPFMLGYHGVETAIKKLEGEPVQSQVLESVLQVRGSCGCEMDAYDRINVMFSENDTEEQIHGHTAIILNEITNHPDGEQIKEKLGAKISDIITILLEPYEKDKEDSKADMLMESVKVILKKKYIGYYSPHRFQHMMFRFTQSLIEKAENIEEKRYYCRLSTTIFTTVSMYLQAEYQKNLKRGKKEAWYATYVTRDTMAYSVDEREALLQIVKKMQLLNFKSSYIYLFKKPIKNYDNRYWVCPERMYLAAKQDRNGVASYEVEERPYITLSEGIERAIDSQERYIAMHFSLFSNETQYGLLVCEADIQEASFAYSISLQIGSSLKFLEMMQEQMNMQKRLQDSLEIISRKNDLLNHLSISDELTGLLNRRGVFDAILDKLADCPGKLVAMFFIDMDNLKQVNDTFGHNEGDFSLRSISKILKESFREQDSVGRIGGDEFLAYVEVDEQNLVHHIRKEIERLTTQLNKECKKPYYIEMSVGVKEFIAHPQMDLKDILKEADHVLYADKKEKRKSCLKEVETA